MPVSISKQSPSPLKPWQLRIWAGVLSPRQVAPWCGKGCWSVASLKGSRSDDEDHDTRNTKTTPLSLGNSLVYFILSFASTYRWMYEYVCMVIWNIYEHPVSWLMFLGVLKKLLYFSMSRTGGVDWRVRWFDRKGIGRKKMELFLPLSFHGNREMVTLGFSYMWLQTHAFTEVGHIQPGLVWKVSFLT